MNRIRIIIFFLIIVFGSCTPQKKLIYFQGEIPSISSDSIYKARIYAGDLLLLNIFTINSEAYPYLSSPKDAPGADSHSAYEKGNVVNENGEIKLPLIGTVLLKGLTLAEASFLLGQV